MKKEIKYIILCLLSMGILYLLFAFGENTIDCSKWGNERALLSNIWAMVIVAHILLYKSNKN